jgi:hypothetical protein
VQVEPVQLSKKEFVEGKHYYLENGYIVLTENYHKQRGFCCGNKCRHCPFEPSYVKGTIDLKSIESKE